MPHHSLYVLLLHSLKKNKLSYRDQITEFRLVGILRGSDDLTFSFKGTWMDYYLQYVSFPQRITLLYAVTAGCWHS